MTDNHDTLPPDTEATTPGYDLPVSVEPDAHLALHQMHAAKLERLRDELRDLKRAVNERLADVRASFDESIDRILAELGVASFHNTVIHEQVKSQGGEIAKLQRAIESLPCYRGEACPQRPHS
jgi:hypothetical protein